MTAEEELKQLKEQLQGLIEKFNNWMPKDPSTGPLYKAGMMEGYMQAAQELAGLFPASIGGCVFNPELVATPAEELTEVKIVLVGLPQDGKSLYDVCKAIRSVQPMTLPDSIFLIRKVGREEAVVKEGVPRQEALQIKEMFKKAGATVTLI